MTCPPRSDRRFQSAMGWILATGVLCLSAAGHARTVTYAMALGAPGGQGGQALSFTGNVEAGRITGTLTIGSMQVLLDGTLSNAGASGVLKWPGGTRAGEFSGRVGRDYLTGTYLLDGAGGDWKVPLSAVPNDIRALLK